MFDVARTCLIEGFDSNQGSYSQQIFQLPRGTLQEKLRFLLSKDVGVLICGAITEDAAVLLRDSGIKVYPFVAGEVSAVIDAWRIAWRNGRTYLDNFFMPGCRGRRRFRGGNVRGGMTGNTVPFREQKRYSRGYGRMQIISAGSELCACHCCGFHCITDKGIPCAEQMCPVCGTLMVRVSGFMRFPKDRG